jgi:hypothetical protein
VVVDGIHNELSYTVVDERFELDSYPFHPIHLDIIWIPLCACLSPTCKPPDNDNGFSTSAKPPAPVLIKAFHVATD